MPLGPSLRRPLLILVLVIALVTYCSAGALWQIRFSYVPANYWMAAILSISLPISMLWVALRIQRKLLKIVAIVFTVLVALPFLLFSALALFESTHIENNTDNSFALISEGKRFGVYYRLYRSDCGATCSTDLVLRKEYDSHVGIKLVTPIWFERHQPTGTIQVDDRGTIRVMDGEQLLAALQQ